MAGVKDGEIDRVRVWEGARVCDGVADAVFEDVGVAVRDDGVLVCVADAVMEPVAVTVPLPVDVRVVVVLIVDVADIVFVLELVTAGVGVPVDDAVGVGGGGP